MKTMKEWYASKHTLSEFLQVGDVVDETIADYFIETMPPRTQNAYSNSDGGAI